MTLKFARAASVAALLLLAACGKSGSSSPAANNEACAMIADAKPLFGGDAETSTSAPADSIASACHWQSADGRRGGDLIVFTPATQIADVAKKWGGMTATPLAAVAHVGDEAQIATDLPGYQAQIVFRKGTKVVGLLAWSGDPAMTSEALARAMATGASR